MNNTQSLHEFVDQGNILWQKAAESIPRIVRTCGCFSIDQWPAGTGDTKVYNEFETEQFAHEKGEGAQLGSSKNQIGYEKIVRPYRIGTTVTISWELNRRGKYRELTQKMTALGQYCPNRWELDAQHLIGMGTAASYVNMDGRTVDTSTGDGYAVFYTAHKVKGSATTFRNILANNPLLSKGALENMELMIKMNAINQFGESVGAENFDILWTTNDPNTVNTARELLRATSKLGEANDGTPNVYQGKYKHVILNRVDQDANGNYDTTKAKYWGFIASNNSPHLVVIEEDTVVTPPSVGSNGEEFLTEDLTWKTTSSGAVANLSGRGTTLSKGNGDA